MTRFTAKKLREGVLSLFPDYYSSFIEEQTLEDIEGIGPTTAKSLRERGMNVHLLETTPVRELEQKYGLTSNSALKYQSAIHDARGGFLLMP